MRCPICRSEFVANRGWQKFCGTRCKNRAKMRRRKGAPHSPRQLVKTVEAWEAAIGRGECPSCRSRAFIIDGAYNCCGQKTEES